MSVPPRVCIITSGALGSNPRSVKEAQALVTAGFDVTVIATRTLAIIDPLDEDILARAHWNAQRLDFRSRWKWRGCRGAQFIFAQCYAATGCVPLADRGVSAFSGSLIAAAKRVKAQLYIAHYPAALPAAAIAARTHNSTYAFDAEDFHMGEFADETEHELELRMIRTIEAHYLANCSYVTAASPGIADAYVETYGIARPTIVLNVFPRSQAPAAATTKGSSDPGPSVYWFSQTIGPDRGLECAVRAVGFARSQPHLYLRGISAKGYCDRLKNIAIEAGVLNCLHVLPPATPFEMERMAATFDVGLVSETGHTVNRRIALTNKQFTYMLAGIPAIMSDTPAHRAFATEVGDAVRLYDNDDALSLAAALDALLCDRDALTKARETAWRLGRERFNWDVEKASFLELISGIFDTSVCNREGEAA